LGNCIIKLYGISQEPETKNYIMVLDYTEYGNLRDYLSTINNELSLNDKINHLYRISYGIKDIHEKELIHRDLHIGNILKIKYNTVIADMGLCKPADYNALNNNVYGILPYVAPEIL
jgi:serine/threonine protein kinase